MTRRDADPRRVYDCPFPSHEEFGVHLHETCRSRRRCSVKLTKPSQKTLRTIAKELAP